MIYLIISLFLDLNLSNIIDTSYQNINYIFPCLLISSLTISYLLTKNKKIVIISSLIIGLLYDLLYSDIFLINTSFITLYLLFINMFYKQNKPTYLNVILLSTLSVIIYDIYIFLILILLKYSNFKFIFLTYKLKNTIFLNFIYILLSIFILKSRIFSIKKR